MIICAIQGELKFEVGSDDDASITIQTGDSETKLALRDVYRIEIDQVRAIHEP